MIIFSKTASFKILQKTVNGFIVLNKDLGLYLNEQKSSTFDLTKKTVL